MNKIDVHFTRFTKGDNWTEGDVGPYHFHAKLFDQGSTYGINFGRVSKLSVYTDDASKTGNYGFDHMIVNYDRGWDIKVPRTKGVRAHFNALMKFLESAPPLFEDELVWVASKVIENV